MTKIFLNYRRQYSGGYIGRLHQALVERYGEAQIFWDQMSIPAGANFNLLIQRRAKESDVLLVLIGRVWLKAQDKKGRYRLFKSKDYVRREIEAAIAHNTLLIPVLVDNGTVPVAGSLPQSINSLAHCQGIQFSDLHWNYGLSELFTAIDKHFGIPPRLFFEPHMMPVEAGEFIMGSTPRHDPYAKSSEQPQHRVFLEKYYLAKTPVTRKQWWAFLEDTGYVHSKGLTRYIPGSPRPRLHALEFPEGPIGRITYEAAIEYCRWLSFRTGKFYRLPNEAEWEKAARGTDGRLYPWGNKWSQRLCQTAESGIDQPQRVASYSNGASPYGILDMAGLVLEITWRPPEQWVKQGPQGVLEHLESWWTGDDPIESYQQFNYPFNVGQFTKPEWLKQYDLFYISGDDLVLRGGGYWLNKTDARCAARFIPKRGQLGWEEGIYKESILRGVGFRVALPNDFRLTAGERENPVFRQLESHNRQW